MTPGAGLGPAESVLPLLAALEELDLDRYTVIGKYARFDPGLRASLDELRQRLVAGISARGSRPLNFLVWGPPGCGKSYLIAQIAASLGADARYLELNLSQLEEPVFRQRLSEAWQSSGALLCFVDECDARPDATWPYELLLSYLEPTVARPAATCFVLAGSGGTSPEEMRRSIAARPKGADLLSRIPATNEYRVPPLATSDRILVAAVQFIDAAREEGREIRDIEKLALLYAAAAPVLASARQLRALADQTARRIPAGERRLRYDYLFRAGDPENKEFWSRVQGQSAGFVGSFVRVRIPPAVPAASNPVRPAEVVHPAPEATVPPVARIAVLPFRNISPDASDAYLADGLTEEIGATLAKVPGLDVVSQASAQRYRTTPAKSAPEIGKELRAGSLLDGSVRKSGHRIRISAQFVDTQADRQVWTETFEGDLDELFDVQQRIAARIADTLSTRLGQTTTATQRARPTPSAEAYLLFLKGRAAHAAATRERLELAIELYGQALALDPSYADALAGIAESYRRIGFWELAPEADALLKAQEFARRALAIDPTSIPARITLAFATRSLDWDDEAAAREVRRLAQTEPRNPRVHLALANLLNALGQIDEAAAEARRGVELDPQSGDVREQAGTVLLYARKYEEAVANLRIALALDPRNGEALHNLGLALVQSGSIEEGIAAMEDVSRRSEAPGPVELMELAYGHARARHTEQVEALLRRILREAAQSPAWWAAAGAVYANTGRIDDAFDALEKAVSGHAAFLISHVRSDFILDPLRDDPRFAALLQRLAPRVARGR